MSFRYRGATYPSGHSDDASDERPAKIYRGAPVPDEEPIAPFPPRFVARLVYRGAAYLRLR